ncbi:transcriptional coactivator p15/PC4 family protein [Desulfobacca acetoxidans]|uniref:Transcriptional coactivator p15 (PC4) C-terminal domain-containing protein n=1 Tax=Desulfobacca acetoxidans (strain ATCC 700848 / DSM 11109 / ASRB2) TaxID=880072 RepID=F2NG11_DESAR|nr:hypothetical protein Desac_0538 [Desulfobacca acetoxidans DSM 11109]
MEKPLVTVNKNTKERYHFSIREYQGHKFVDVRLHFLADDEQSWHPTKKGITVLPSLWRDFRAALDQVEAELVRRKLIER